MTEFPWAIKYINNIHEVVDCFPPDIFSLPLTSACLHHKNQNEIVQCSMLSLFCFIERKEESTSHSHYTIWIQKEISEESYKWLHCRCKSFSNNKNNVPWLSTLICFIEHYVGSNSQSHYKMSLLDKSITEGSQTDWQLIPMLMK